MEQNQRQTDPSLNVQALVENAVQHLRDLHNMGQKYYEDRLALAVDSSRREREAESRRIDACRRDDLENVKVANQASVEQAKLLANNLVENAETLRASMAKTAETIAVQLQEVTRSLDSRLKIVEEKQFSFAGASKGSRDMWGWILSGILALITAYSFFSK